MARLPQQQRHSAAATDFRHAQLRLWLGGGEGGRGGADDETSASELRLKNKTSDPRAVRASQWRSAGGGGGRPLLLRAHPAGDNATTLQGGRRRARVAAGAGGVDRRKKSTQRALLPAVGNNRRQGGGQN